MIPLWCSEVDALGVIGFLLWLESKCTEEEETEESALRDERGGAATAAAALPRSV
jgi:hypothetical protein